MGGPVEGGFARLMTEAAIWPPAKYLEAKLVEERQRRARFNDTAYNLEPNLKDGPGGLRALQLIRWLGARLFDAPALEQLVAHGLLSETERAAVESAEGVVWRIRYALHLIAGRAEERLLFDYQRELARRLGYSDEHAQNLGVEQFMQG